MYPFALEAESTKIETILFGEFLRLKISLKLISWLVWILNSRIVVLIFKKQYLFGCSFTFFYFVKSEFYKPFS